MSTLEGNLEGGVTSGGVILDLDERGRGSSSGIIQRRWLLGCRIHLRTETLALADDYVRTPTGMYEGLILNFGHIERSISAPAGPPRVGDCLVRVDDTNQRLRKLLAVQTGLRRLIELFRISDEQLIGGFEITGIAFGDGYVEFTGTDITAKWMDRPIPSLGTRTNFPWMIEGVDEFFMPIIFGEQFSAGDNPQGMIRCPHMGPTFTTGSPVVAVDRYAASRHTLYLADNIAVVYRKLSTDSAFSVVDSTEYFFTEGEFFVSDGVTYFPTYLDFFANQEADAEIRIDTHGVNHTLSSEFSDTVILLTRFWGFPTAIRNPIDFLLFVIYEMIQSVGGDNRVERYNASALESVRSYYETNGLYCDGAIVEPKTITTILSELSISHELYFYVNRHYQYEAAVPADDAGRPILTDAIDFSRVTPQYAQDPVNRINYGFGLNPSTGQYAGAGTYDLTADQAELGNVEYQGNVDQVEAETVQLPYVSVEAVAASSMVRRSDFKRLGSHRTTFIVSTPEWFETLEIMRPVGVTHYGGIADGGWINTQFIPLSLRHDLSALQTSVDAILLTPVEY